MMKSALILPTEDCVDSDTLKRALLNYEKVYLKNPDDRDFVSGNDLMSIAFGGLGMSMGNSGPAKPLGKEKNHDLNFEKLLSQFKPALDEGSLIVMDKPADIYHQGMGIGYHIEELHRFVYWNYRHMLANEEFIRAASRGLDRNWLKENNFDELAPVGGDDGLSHADERLNNKISYLGNYKSEEEHKVLTRMIHARIAAISRNLMICHLKGLVPFTTNQGYSSVINQMQSNFSTLVTEANDGSIELSNLDLIGKVEKVMFSDFLDQSKISNLTLKDTLKLRTKMWGKYGENKTKLEEKLLKIALDSKDLQEFEKKIKDQFEKFLKENRDYVHERGNLGIKLACNVGTIVTGSSFGPAVIQNFISASSIELLMALACPMTFLLAEKRLPDIRNVLKKENELARLPVYDLYNYFKPIIK